MIESLKNKYTISIRAYTLLLTSCSILLFNAFLYSDFSLAYVFEYSSSELLWFYKISAFWAGTSGSLLLWAWLISLFIWWWSEKVDFNSQFVRRTTIFSIIIGLFFLTITLVDSPFRSITGSVLENLWRAGVDGMGLNPLLRDPWMVIHPPILFVGYAAITLPAAAAIAYLINPDESWEKLTRQWSRIAWIFLMAGIAIGGFWSYKVLGWGGFWAWDPVETTSFIPWLTMTAFLHGTVQYRKNRKFNFITPLLGIVSLLLVVYATFVTRSGIHESFHSFGESATSPFFLIFIAAVIIATIASAIRFISKQIKLTGEESISLLSKQNLILLTIIAFVMLTFISLWGTTYPVIYEILTGMKISIEKSFFNFWSLPFTIILFLTMWACMLFGFLKEGLLVKTLMLLIAATVGSILIKPTENFYANALLPSAFLVIGGVIFGLLKIIKTPRSFARSIKLISPYVIHLGVAFIIIGIVVSTAFQKEIFEKFNIGENKEIGREYGLSVTNISAYVNWQDFTWAQKTDLFLNKNGVRVGEGNPLIYYNLRPMLWGGESEGPFAKVYIHRTLLFDIYVAFEGVGSEEEIEQGIPLRIKMFPLVNFLWFGVILVSLGGALLIISEPKK
ncbi:MAG: cytochrome c biogenesis protein CcsA [Euryarchaeota archaeon]|nr:cytochrome c biogenesis protein CcsA [Euryarchaeota archaeon]